MRRLRAGQNGVEEQAADPGSGVSGNALRLPRVVIVHRPTALTRVSHQHGTKGQAMFRMRVVDQEAQYLRLVEADLEFHTALQEVEAAIPKDQRRTRVERDLLDRFVFEPDDIILVIGQDGLVANVAKYLQHQLVIGVNPDPSQIDGVLCQHAPSKVGQLLAWARNPGARFRIEERTMAVAELDDGQRLLALNEIFVGHKSHQSARYRLRLGDAEERHSSSGLICTAGTGATGWARSICLQRGLLEMLPAPTADQLVFLAREPFPTVATGTSIDHGVVARDQQLIVASDMPADGVVFADGIESDHLDFVVGNELRISVADRRLRLLVSAGDGS